MELKHLIDDNAATLGGLLIVPYGIETWLYLVVIALRVLTFNRTLWN